MPLLSIADGALFAERFGSGPARVLALHGWGRRGADFTASLSGFDALALDLPGFGASPPPTAATGAAGYAELIGPVFGMFDSPPVVVGHSFGGRVAVARQAAHPGSAAGLVLTGSPLLRLGSPKKPPLGYRLARMAHRAGLVPEQTMERRRQRYGSSDYRAARGVMREILVRVVNESYEDELGRLGVPVHLLWGTEDTEAPVAIAHRAHELIRAAGDPVSLDLLEGEGHHLPLRRPQALAEAVAEMLDRVGG